MTFQARPYQIAAAEAPFTYWAKGGPGSPLIVCPTGCHARGTRVILEDGRLRAVEDVRVGDRLLGVDGPRTVLALCRGRDQMVRVVPIKGDPFVVNMDHVLSLASTNEGKQSPSTTTGEERVNVTVREWLGWSKSKKHLYKLHRSTGVEFTGVAQRAPVIPPYTMGALLGDGSMVRGGTVAITTMDNEIAEDFERMVKAHGGSIRLQRKPNNRAATYCARGAPSLKSAIEYVGADVGCEIKHIPDMYKLGTRDVRRSVLAGLMDTDGSLSRSGFDYISKSKRLSEDVAFVARSLGLAAYVSPCRKGCQTGAVGDYYRVSISGDTGIIPTRLARKKAPPRGQKKRVHVTGFSVEMLQEDDFFGFTLDGDHLYHLDDFTITHNSGKSPIMGMITHRLVQDYSARVLILAHRKELITQDAAAVRLVWPDAPVAIYSAGVGQKRVDQITVAGIQSLARNPKVVGKVDVALIDECHLINGDDEDTSYRKTLDALREINPDLRCLGLTATPYRLGQGLLTSGERPFFDCIAYEVKVADLVAQGWLSPLVSSKAGAVIDTANAKTAGGDWVAKDLELAADLDQVNEAVADDVAEQIRLGRKSVLVFGVSVAHAAHMRNALKMRGINTETVVGDTPNRSALLDAFKRQELTCITSCDVLTTGFDAPCVDVIALVRPTKSVGLYVQMLGRGMRLHAGKTNCVVLDYGGNVARHGPITDLKIKEPSGRGKTGDAAMKECPTCHAFLPIGTRVCVHCDHEFVFERKANAQASQLDPMQAPPPPEPKKYRKPDVRCRVHKSKTKDSVTMRVDYMDGAGYLASEFICIEHQGFALQKAKAWWRAAFLCPFPESVEEGVRMFEAGQMRPVLSIVVKPDGEWKRVTQIEFDDTYVAPEADTGFAFGAAEDEQRDPFDGDEIPF